MLQVFIIFIIVLFPHTHVLAQFDPCSKQFELVTDLNVDKCGEDFYQPSGNSRHGCFPECHKKWDFLKDSCDEEGESKYKCPPGYKCVKPKEPEEGEEQEDDPKCEIDEQSCFKYYGEDRNNNWTKGIWKPKCNPDGTWKPKQCKPWETDDGRCFCSDSVGNRIFGEAYANVAENMTCACSRRRTELLQEGSRYYVSLHCNSEGNYEPLQCDSGQCWCVEPMTGKMTSATVPEGTMSILPCYKNENVGMQYLRQCESEEYAQAYITHQYKTHGVVHANFPYIFCDADGTYGPYQILNTVGRCTWKDKSQLASYEIKNLQTAKCNCARAEKVISESGGRPMQCETVNGGYEQIQRDTNGKVFCVDNDGFRKSDVYTEFPKDFECEYILQ